VSLSLGGLLTTTFEIRKKNYDIIAGFKEMFGTTYLPRRQKWNLSIVDIVCPRLDALGSASFTFSLLVCITVVCLTEP